MTKARSSRAMIPVRFPALAPFVAETATARQRRAARAIGRDQGEERLAWLNFWAKRAGQGPAWEAGQILRIDNRVASGELDYQPMAAYFLDILRGTCRARACGRRLVNAWPKREPWLTYSEHLSSFSTLNAALAWCGLAMATAAIRLDRGDIAAQVIDKAVQLYEQAVAHDAAVRDDFEPHNYGLQIVPFIDAILIARDVHRGLLRVDDALESRVKD